MGLYAKLAKVQHELKAPKNQFNDFGKYNYRSCEDILQAAKPLCVDNGLVLTLSDTIIEICGWHYVNSTATVIDVEDGTKHEVTAQARESESKKGMDSAQVTGSTSSYARKYALNGLFAIDDTKDSDATNGKDDKPTAPPKAPYKPVKLIPSQPAPQPVNYITDDQAVSVANQCAETESNIKEVMQYFSITTLDKMTSEQFAKFEKMMVKKREQKEQTT